MISTTTMINERCDTTGIVVEVEIKFSFLLLSLLRSFFFLRRLVCQTKCSLFLFLFLSFSSRSVSFRKTMTFFFFVIIYHFSVQIFYYSFVSPLSLSLFCCQNDFHNVFLSFSFLLPCVSLERDDELSTMKFEQEIYLSTMIHLMKIISN